MALDDTAAFADHDPLIGVHAWDGFHVAYRAVRPADRQIRFCGVAHAEVDAEISLGDVVSAAANFVDLLPPANRQRQSRTDGVPARSGNGADEQRVAPGPEVLQQGRRLEEIDDDDLLGTVVVEVPDGDAARRMFCGNAGATGRGHIEELAVAAIPEQLAGLFEFFSEVVLLDEWVHVAVGDEQVRPSVVVEVQEGGAPFHILGVHAQDRQRW